MPDPPSLHDAVETLLRRAKKDEALRAELTDVLRALLTELESPTVEPIQTLAPEPNQEVMEMRPEVVSNPASPKPPVNTVSPSPSTQPSPVEYPNLSGLRERLALKARACRWRARYGYTKDELALRERNALLAEASDLSCYVWTLTPYVPDDPAVLNDLARAYELTVRAFSLFSDAIDEKGADELLSYAQRTLRASVERLKPDFSDPDQFLLYRALRLDAQASQRYLAQLQLASVPLELDELAQTIDRFEEAHTARRGAEANLERHANTLRKQPGKGSSLTGLETALATLAEHGVDLERYRPLVQVAAPHADPERHPLLAGFAPRAATHELDEPAGAFEEDSPVVDEARTLVGGSPLLIVGGDLRAEARERLERAFGCEVRWLETKPHTSPELLAQRLTPELAAVILLIRWASHAYQELAPHCRELGIPLVRAPAGYSPNRLAVDLVEQAGRRLGAS